VNLHEEAADPGSCRHLTFDENNMRCCLLCGHSYDRAEFVARLRKRVLERRRPPSLSALRARAQDQDPFGEGEEE
jgi:hypothetical protein